MYKDKDKQREADRERQKRRRDKIKAKGVTNSGCDKQGVTDIARDKAIEYMSKTAGVAERAEPKRSYIGAVPETPDTTSPKRGKDIKCFEDLPPDVQQTIDSMSIVEGKIDQTIKANRTAIAIAYQHTFPERY